MFDSQDNRPWSKHLYDSSNNVQAQTAKLSHHCPNRFAEDGIRSDYLFKKCFRQKTTDWATMINNRRSKNSENRLWKNFIWIYSRLDFNESRKVHNTWPFPDVNNHISWNWDYLSIWRVRSQRLTFSSKDFRTNLIFIFLMWLTGFAGTEAKDNWATTVG